MNETCGLCGRDRAGAESQSAVRVDGQWIARFVYRPHDATDKAWKATEGLTLASHAKAVPGTPPYVWPHADSARFVAAALGGTVARLCEECAPRGRKRSTSRKRKGRPNDEDE